MTRSSDLMSFLLLSPSLEYEVSLEVEAIRTLPFRVFISRVESVTCCRVPVIAVGFLFMFSSFSFTFSRTRSRTVLVASFCCAMTGVVEMINDKL